MIRGRRLAALGSLSRLRGCPLHLLEPYKQYEANPRRSAAPQEKIMDTTTLLIILIVLLVLGGGGYYGRRRWF